MALMIMLMMAMGFFNRELFSWDFVAAAIPATRSTEVGHLRALRVGARVV